MLTTMHSLVTCVRQQHLVGTLACGLDEKAFDLPTCEVIL